MPGWLTATDPSTTDTTEPPRPADTAKTVPFTDAIESRVSTRRCPRRCLAAPDDDVAALEVNRLPAPGGGGEQLRSLVDVHGGPVGEPQHGVGSRAGADELSFGDCGARCERFPWQAVQAALGGHDRGSRTAGSHHRVDGVASAHTGPPGPVRLPRPAFPIASSGRKDRCGMAITRRSPFSSASERAARRAAAEMVVHQDAPAAAERSAEIGAEVRPELRAAAAGGAGHLVPDARARGLERRRRRRTPVSSSVSAFSSRSSDIADLHLDPQVAA